MILSANRFTSPGHALGGRTLAQSAALGNGRINQLRQQGGEPETAAVATSPPIDKARTRSYLSAISPVSPAGAFLLPALQKP
jgi:hypothetical protein